MILQLLPLDAHCHGPQLFIHTEVIGMLCKGRPGKYGQMSGRRGHRPQPSGAVGWVRGWVQSHTESKKSRPMEKP